MNYDTPAFEALLMEQESGASALLYRFIQILSEHLEGRPDIDRNSGLEIFSSMYSRVLEAHPLMAIFPNLRLYLEDGSREKDGVSLLNSLSDFRNILNLNIQRTVEKCAEIFNDKNQIFTFSHSSIVRQAILEMKKRRKTLTVNITESRPVREGVALAKVLSRAGVQINLFADAAMERALDMSDVIFVGTDWYWDKGFVNKIGTHAILRTAREKGLDFAVLTDSSKAMDAGPTDWSRDEHPSSVLLAEKETNIRVHNPYFEAMSYHGVTHRIVDGQLTTP